MNFWQRMVVVISLELTEAYFAALPIFVPQSAGLVFRVARTYNY